MPLYEYACRDCGHEFEALQKMADAPLVDCPACQAPALTKKVSAAGFRLAGSGWYETDFKNGNRRNIAGAEKGGAKSGDAGGGKSTDAAAAAPAAKSTDAKPKAAAKPASGGSSASP